MISGSLVHFAELIKQIPKLHKLAIDSRDARAKAADLAKAFKLLQKHFPSALCTTVFNEWLLTEYRAQALDHELFTSVTELLLASPKLVQRKNQQ